MKSAKSLYIALFAVSLLVAGNVTVRARTTQQTGDQAKGDSSTAANSRKKNADSAATPKKNSSKSSVASRAAAAPVSKPPPIYLTRWATQRLLPSQPRLRNRPAGKQRWHGLGQHGLWRVSQARHTLVWKNQTREVHDRSRRPKSQLSPGGSGCAAKEIELVNLCRGLRAARGVNFLALTFRAG